MKIQQSLIAKKKNAINKKLQLIAEFMNDFLGVSDDVEENDPVKFISNVSGIDDDTLKEDMDLYIETLNGEHGLKEECIKVGSRLLDKRNELSLLAMVVYSYQYNEDLDDWMKDYSARVNNYYENQKENYQHMLDDYKHYKMNSRAA